MTTRRPRQIFSTHITEDEDDDSFDSLIPATATIELYYKEKILA